MRQNTDGKNFILSTRYIATNTFGKRDESTNLVTNWMLESNFSREEFEDYRQALSMFNNISKDGTDVILYELKKSPVNGSTVKKTPLLNSKKIKLNQDHLRESLTENREISLMTIQKTKINSRTLR